MKKSIILSGVISVVLSSITWFTLTSETLPAADNFKVIKVDGKISFVKTGKAMLTGDQFLSDEKLSFATQDARAAVISKINGRFVLTPDAKGGTAVNLVPAMSNVDTRSGALVNALDLKNHFSERYLLLKELELKINKDVYPMNANNFFYLQYEYNGEKVAKKLDKFKEDVLEMTASYIFTIDGKAVAIPRETKVALYYRDDVNKKSNKINDFVLVVPNDSELVDEIKIILADLGNKTMEEKKAEISAYLYEFYGKPQKENLDDWLKNNMGI
jgi:hypothetical protein